MSPINYKNRCIDIIIGDYGRVGTLRFLEEFSNFERSYIQLFLKENQFYDEYRIVDQIVLNSSYSTKFDIISKYSDSNIPLDDNILFGFENKHFEPIELYVDKFYQQVIPFVKNANNLQYSKIRIIIPCNTLEVVAKLLKIKINSNYPNVEIPLLSTSVKSEILKMNFKKIYLISTPEVMKLYSDFFRLNKIKAECNHKKFKNFLNNVISDSQINDNDDNDDNDITISACTDLDVPCDIDTLKLYCKDLVLKVYKDFKTWF